jgi:SecD/SecF fusion protein
MAAVLCLIHDLCFTLGCIALCHYVVVATPGLAHMLGIEDFKIDLTAVAALLTLIGYSVSDTIVVFDRIRERSKTLRREPPPSVMNIAINETLSRTIITSFTVFLTVLALYVLGGEVIHDFAFAMLVGVVFGTYSSVYVASGLALEVQLWLDRANQGRVQGRARK